MKAERIRFEVKKIYSFSTLAENIFGSGLTSLKVKAILDSSQALAYRDIVSLHDNVKLFVSNLPEKIQDLTYILFEKPDGENVLIPEEYIDPMSIKEVGNFGLIITINDIQPSDTYIIRKILKDHGYNNFILEHKYI